MAVVTEADPGEYRRGLIHTVHPRLLAPLEPGEDCRIVVSTRRRIAADATRMPYDALYARARALLAMRVEELRGAVPDHAVHTWVAAHGWFRTAVPGGTLAGAVITLGVMCAPAASPPPTGHMVPTAEQLREPFLDHLPDRAARGDREWDELYNDFDLRDADTPVIGVSYGEYVETCAALDVAAILARAEHRTGRYCESLGASNAPLEIVRQESNCIETGKASRPRLAFVETIVRLR
jgi:hypothetical protein